ncbi:hypothetical protein ACM66B_003918 [Microbotryomycetes sp. NB124-2]
MAGTATMLGPFLTEIGAAAVSPVVKFKLNDENDDAAPFSRLFDRLEQEITTINDQTRVLLEDNWQPFQEQVADGKELLARMDEEQQELADVQQQLDGERLPTLVDKLTAHSQLAQSYSLTTHTLTILTSLLSLHSAVSTVSSHTTAGSLPLAVAALRDLQSALQRGAAPWIEQTDAWSALKRWGADEHTRLEAAILGAFEACFDFVATTSPSSGTTTTTQFEGSKLTLRSNVAAAPKGELLDVPVLLQALEDVFVLGGGTKKVDAQVARVAKHMLKYFITPYLEANGQPSSSSKFDIIYEDVPGAKTATLTKRVFDKDDTPALTSAAEDPLAVVADFLTFFAKNTTLLPPSPYAASFTANLTPIIQQLVISSHLVPSLPSTINELTSFLPTVLAASSFEAKFLPSAGYFAFLPKDSRGRVREEAKVVQSWVDRVDKHWAKKVGDTALERVRRQVQLQDWNEKEIVNVNVMIETDVPGQMQEIQEQEPVSKSLKEVVEVGRALLNEAVAVASASFKHPTFTPAAPHLLHSFASLLSLYRAIAPVQHHSRLSSSETVVIQFANDTDFVSREFEQLWKISNENEIIKGLDGGKVGRQVDEAIKVTSALGKQIRQTHVDKQKRALMDSLDETEHFMYTSDDVTFAKCEKACQAVLDRLDRLSKAWKPVMNRSSFYTTLGNLVNDVLQRILDEIMDHLDISEQESIRLNKLCKQMHQVEALFDDGVTSVGAEVQVWFKFVFLSELLEASMADIMFLFDDGHLVDFEPSAIAKLVRALFSESPLREQNLARIMKGHPVQPTSSSDVERDDEDMDSARRTPPPLGRRSSSGFGTPRTPKTPSFASRQTRAFAPSPESVDRQQRASIVDKKTTSFEHEQPTTITTGTTKTTKSKLGAARITKPVVLQRSSSVSPPPLPSSPPPVVVAADNQSPSPHLESKAVASSTSTSATSLETEVQESTVDDGLDEGFDDDGWGFSPESSPKPQPVDAHRTTSPAPTTLNTEEEARSTSSTIEPREGEEEKTSMKLEDVTTGMAESASTAFGLAKALSLGGGEGDDDGSRKDDQGQQDDHSRRELVEEEMTSPSAANDAWGLDLDDDDDDDDVDESKVESSGVHEESSTEQEGPIDVTARDDPFVHQEEVEQEDEDDSELERSLYVDEKGASAVDEVTSGKDAQEEHVDEQVHVDENQASEVAEPLSTESVEPISDQVADTTTTESETSDESVLASESAAHETLSAPSVGLEDDAVEAQGEVDGSAWDFDEPDEVVEEVEHDVVDEHPARMVESEEQPAEVKAETEEVDFSHQVEAPAFDDEARPVEPVDEEAHVTDGAGSLTIDEQQVSSDHVDPVAEAEVEEEDGDSEPFEFEHVDLPETVLSSAEEHVGERQEASLEREVDVEAEVSPEQRDGFEPEAEQVTESEESVQRITERSLSPLADVPVADGVILADAEPTVDAAPVVADVDEAQTADDEADATPPVAEDATAQIEPASFFGAASAMQDEQSWQPFVPSSTTAEPSVSLFQDSSPSFFDELGHDSEPVHDAPNLEHESSVDSSSDPIDREIAETPDLDEMETAQPFDEQPPLETEDELEPRDDTRTPYLDELESQQHHQQTHFAPLNVDEALSRHVDFEGQIEEQAAVDDLAAAEVHVGSSAFEHSYEVQQPEGADADFVDEESGWGLEEPSFEESDDVEASVPTQQPDVPVIDAVNQELNDVTAIDRESTPVPPVVDAEHDDQETPGVDLFGSSKSTMGEGSDFFSNLARQGEAQGVEEEAPLSQVAHDDFVPESEHAQHVEQVESDGAVEEQEVGQDDDGWGIEDDVEAAFTDLDVGERTIETGNEFDLERQQEDVVPDSPSLGPVDDHDDSVAPTPLQQRTPTTNERALPTMTTVATPWDAMQQQQVQQPEQQISPVHVFSTETASKLEPSLFGQSEGLSSSRSRTDEDDEIDLEAGAGDGDDGWGIEDDLEGLEEAPEDFVVPERVASPTRVPPPPARIDFSPRAGSMTSPTLTSLSQRALQMSPPHNSSRGRGTSMSSSSTSTGRHGPMSPASPARSNHTRSPARKPPATLYQPSVMFSPPPRSTTASKPVNGGSTGRQSAAAADEGDGWGFDEVDDGGLGTIDDDYDASANDAELFRDMSDDAQSGGGAVAADEDAWGF